MNECELEVVDLDLQAGDRVVGWSNPWGGSHTCDYLIVKVEKGVPYLAGDDIFHHPDGKWRMRVRRKMNVQLTQPMVQGVANLGPRAIPDWPLACPRCQRPSSAVLLFVGYDCKHGCFK